ncbi:MAG: hydroxyisourate hydrolase [Betaproteobacteria bacterium]|nr:hydroxyisourate hydrolase [Betaproteobacteria bacterium]
MPGISIHVVDVSRGIVGAGMRVELWHLAPRKLVASGHLSAKGTLDDPVLAGPCDAGTYEALFYVGDFYRTAGVSLPAVPFLEVVPYRFGVADTAQHYHLPFKMTPWGYSCFRGGA